MGYAPRQARLSLNIVKFAIADMHNTANCDGSPKARGCLGNSMTESALICSTQVRLGFNQDLPVSNLIPHPFRGQKAFSPLRASGKDQAERLQVSPRIKGDASLNWRLSTVGKEAAYPSRRYSAQPRVSERAVRPVPEGQIIA